MICGLICWSLLHWNSCKTKPFEGFVPTEQVAKEVARAIWKGMYGEAGAKFAEPFHCEKRGDRWVVGGTFPSRGPDEFVEPVRVVLDSWSGRVLVVTYLDEVIDDAIKRVPSDRILAERNRKKAKNSKINP